MTPTEYPASLMITRSHADARLLKAKLIASEIIQNAVDDNPNVLLLGTDEQKLGIQVVRDVLEWCKVSATHSPRVVIIHHAESLTTEAQNALLRILEEPPDRTTLILTSPSKYNLLPTIGSRLMELMAVTQIPQENIINLQQILDLTWGERLDFLEKNKKALTESSAQTTGLLESWMTQCERELISNPDNSLYLEVAKKLESAFINSLGKGERQLVLELLCLRWPNPTYA